MCTPRPHGPLGGLAFAVDQADDGVTFTLNLPSTSVALATMWLAFS
eukprot:CAMPEP_0180487078 /NCGR_PEP_ID=MMETSP1036_2-20121128/37336_1 /TAXON_ID=632150 /ORGANISM="Azadinium spinosum, Strain 3D9" /LENGTH=45 /DNA_ID= /DNA_START= /DNA_END= /DNA_ORIENTATION=